MNGKGLRKAFIYDTTNKWGFLGLPIGELQTTINIFSRKPINLFSPRHFPLMTCIFFLPFWSARLWVAIIHRHAWKSLSKRQIDFLSTGSSSKKLEIFHIKWLSLISSKANTRHREDSISETHLGEAKVVKSRSRKLFYCHEEAETRNLWDINRFVRMCSKNVNKMKILFLIF